MRGLTTEIELAPFISRALGKSTRNRGKRARERPPRERRDGQRERSARVPRGVGHLPELRDVNFADPDPSTLLKLQTPRYQVRAISPAGAEGRS